MAWLGAALKVVSNILWSTGLDVFLSSCLGTASGPRAPPQAAAQQSAPRLQQCHLQLRYRPILLSVCCQHHPPPLHRQASLRQHPRLRRLQIWCLSLQLRRLRILHRGLICVQMQSFSTDDHQGQYEQ
ncbi:hypothetical protein PF008_g25099 [Phytophthora fragariae]|uniref:Uncharacterized protein n=1 Tax=Phytophthora fragariae TaxID=53985 RepID=A0A6G0QKW5_9STRA|nr:hypothetical protein PF008_g25099 [Phytophthora fragariae]